MKWFPEQLSTTRDIELFNTCEYKWFKLRCEHWSKYSYNNDLQAGGEFAKAIELTRIAYYKEGLSEEESINIGLTNLKDSFGTSYYLADCKDDLKTPDRMAEVFTKYFNDCPLSKQAIVPIELTNDSLAVEQDFTIDLPFEHPHTGKPLKLKCKLDMLGQRDNIVYVVDEKTCKSVLLDHSKQLDLLRTQNQFVQYVTIGNMQKELLGDLRITHVCIRKCKIKKSYAKNENAVESYEFAVDAWFQKTWWNNLLLIIDRMLVLYSNSNLIIRNYGSGCTQFFSPCLLTYHCTNASGQDLSEQGFEQRVHNSNMNEPMSLFDFVKQQQGV